MTSLLSNLVNNLSETCGIIYEVSDCFLEYTNFKVDVIEYNCLRCNKNYQRKFDENLKNDFSIHINFLTTPIISLFYCYEKVICHCIYQCAKDNKYMIDHDKIKECRIFNIGV